MGKEELRIDLIKDPLVRRALEGAAVTFTPEDPNPDSRTGSRVPMDRKPKTGVKSGDVAFHFAFQASDSIIVSGHTSTIGRITKIDKLTREDMSHS